MSSMEFVEFPKIPRLKRNITVTEKIDGTNAQIHIRHLGLGSAPFEPGYDTQVGDLLVRAGSRSRWLPVPDGPGDDNFGFGRWVWAHAYELAPVLGPGAHFGEWWGAGIQRRYGLETKRFSLFNTHRWKDTVFPVFGVGIVPVLYEGPMVNTDELIDQLRRQGSIAAPGFMAPEGIVVYHHASRSMFKQTLSKDEEPKGGGK